MKSRLEHIDIIKGIAIILVIVGHQASLFQNEDISSWVNSFHLPLFMFAGGFISYKTVKPEILYLKGWFNFLFKKFKALIIPYTLWSIIIYPLLKGNLQFNLIDGVYKYFITPPSTVLWFLHTYFLLLILFSLYFVICTKIKKTSNLLVDLSVISILYFLCFVLEHFFLAIPHTLIAFFPYYFLGVLLARFSKIDTLSKNEYVYTLLFLLFSICSLHYNKVNSQIVNVLIKLLAGGSASLFLYQFTQKICFSKRIKKTFLLFGQNSLIIYIVHFTLLIHVPIFENTNMGSQFWIFLITVLIAVIIAFVSVGFGNIVNQIRMLDVLLFGRKSNRRIK